MAAHSIRLGALTDELITLITQLSASDDSHNYQLCRQFASRTLRSHEFGRTNQFEVQERLQSVDEKFRVLNRDDLADALQSRLDEFSVSKAKWEPEILSLLLQLSDKPHFNPDLEDLISLKPPEEPPPLTWSDILADDPLSEASIWGNVDFADHSSEDDEDTSSDASELTTYSSNAEGTQCVANRDILCVPRDTSVLKEIHDAQFWRHSIETGSATTPLSSSEQKGGNLGSITELQAVRETLFMLSGRPTSLYTMTGTAVTPNARYALEHTNHDTFQEILGSFASIGTKFIISRSWLSKTQHISLAQAFQAAVEIRLGDFNKNISRLESRYFANNGATVVSLISVLQEILVTAEPLLRLSDLIQELESNEKVEPFKHLERLFEEATNMQMIGNEPVFNFMSKLFFECFTIYLQPLQDWMVHGNIREDDGTFFIYIQNRTSRITTLWHDRYSLRLSDSGELFLPKFLHIAAKKIFNTGKSVGFLKELRGYAPPAADWTIENNLSYEAVCGKERLPLSLFAESFDMALDDWIKQRHHAVASDLRELLFSDCGLWRSLEALQYVYFLRDGSLSNIMASSIFDKIDRGKEVWNDRFLLTELVQTVYSTIKCVDVDRLAVQSIPGGYRDIHNRRRSVKILTSMSFTYALPWPVMNIINPESLHTYSRISILLLQTLRALQLIVRQRVLSDQTSDDHYCTVLAQSTRHNLLWLYNTLYTYLTTHVIASSTEALYKRLGAAEDVDAMIDVHAVYIKSLEAKCLLSKALAPIMQAIISLLDLSILFADAQALYIGENLFNMTNRSTSSFSSVFDRHRRPRRRKKTEQNSEDESEDDELEDGGEADISYISFQDEGYLERLQKMQHQFKHLVSFVTAGLRSVSRVGGEPGRKGRGSGAAEESECWEVLAEKLEWGMDRGNASMDGISAT